MSTAVSELLKMSFHGSVLLLLVMGIRAVCPHMPKRFAVWMWAVAAVRLVCPFVLTSVFSLMPAVTTPKGGELLTLTLPGDTVSIPVAAYCPDWLTTAAVVWGIGAAVMVLYTVAAFCRTHKTLREAVCLSGNVYECDRIPTPFIFGLIRPRIYVPSSMNEQDRVFVIAHEQAHLRRLDHLWKPLGFAVLTLHWFNPLVWVSYVLFCRDMETACDEQVIGTLGADSKKPYADALINCASTTRRIAACPLAFGETDVKTRVRRVLSYRKPSPLLKAAGVSLCLLLSLCFLTNPAVSALAPVQNEPPQTTASAVPTTPTTPTAPQTEPTLVQYTQEMTVEAISARVVTAGDALTVRVRVTDSRGVQNGVQVLLFCENEDGEYRTAAEEVTLSLCEGDAKNGIYEGTVTIPQDAQTGDYRLRATYRPVSEKPAFCTAYTPEGEAAVTVE